jgi:hypothetical protein
MSSATPAGSRIPTDGEHPASFRDPSGFLFFHDGTLYRRVDKTYRDNYEHLMQSGFYEDLVRNRLLISHEEVDPAIVDHADAFRVLRPQPIGFVSYPYEWCFSQLKDAALTTLTVQERALIHDMTLKDGSAYNIQFVRGGPLLIDTLSFERYKDGMPWIGYRQFCQHFLAPLALMSYRDARLGSLLRDFIDGIPLDLASRLLPRRTFARFSLLSHLHLHAASQAHFAATDGRSRSIKRPRVSRNSLRGLIDNLRTAIERLRWTPRGTQWVDYYKKEHRYTDEALAHKLEIVGNWIDWVGPATVWDLGANTGLFSRLASDRGIPTVSLDIDPAAVERNWVQCKRMKEEYLLPLLQDLTNPSPGIGWSNSERQSLAERGPAELILALALIHHLAISNNVPFRRVAAYFRRLSPQLIIEFVPKQDPQVQRLLVSRKDIFTDYNMQTFEAAFAAHYSVRQKLTIKGSERCLYLMGSD